MRSRSEIVAPGLEGSSGHEIDVDQDAEAVFRALLEPAPDAMVIAGCDGGMVLVNRQTETLFGYGRDEVIGSPVELLVPGASKTGRR